MAKLQNVRGTYDLYGAAKRKVKKVISTASEVVEKYGFEEIETPIFEFTEVFSRNLGDTSDIVTKEMYCFQDRGGESLTLRPEGTAGVVRSFISEGMQQNLPVKLYYQGPMFRYERPQKGRQRQFTQFGVEMLGVATPQADIEVIAMAYEFLLARNIRFQPFRAFLYQATNRPSSAWRRLNWRRYADIFL